MKNEIPNPVEAPLLKLSSFPMFIVYQKVQNKVEIANLFMTAVDMCAI